MKKGVLILLMFLACAIDANAQQGTVKSVQPSVSQILDAFIGALGGRENIMKLKDRTSDYRGETGGMVFRFRTLQMVPGMISQSMEMGALRQSLVSDGISGKTITMQDSSAIEKPAVKDLLLEDLRAPLEIASICDSIVYRGQVRLGEKDCYRISMKKPSGGILLKYYDVKTGLLLRDQNTIKTPKGEITQTSDYEDYRDISGVKFPFRIIQQMGTQSLILTAESMELNTGLSKDLFKVD